MLPMYQPHLAEVSCSFIKLWLQNINPLNQPNVQIVFFHFIPDDYLNTGDIRMKYIQVRHCGTVLMISI